MRKRDIPLNLLALLFALFITFVFDFPVNLIAGLTFMCISGILYFKIWKPLKEIKNA